MIKLTSVNRRKIIYPFVFAILLVNIQIVNGYLLTHSFTDVNGNSTPLSVYEGKLLLLEAFATDCYWCQEEHSELEQLHQEFKNDIFMVSISIKTDAQSIMTLSEYLKQFPTTWPIGFDDGFQFSQQFNIQSTPTMILFNQEGKLLQQSVGFTPYEELSQSVGQYLLISNPQPDDTIDGYDGESSSGSVIEDLFGSTLFRISFFSILVIMIYVKMTSSKTVV